MDIAKILNITQPTYSAFENGTKIIPLKHLNTLWAHEVSYKKKGGSNKQLGQNLYTIFF